jgi:Protein of unknown function (DUF642)
MIARIAAATGLALFCLANQALAANLIRNGSFEKPVVPDGGFVVFNAGDKFSGWTVVGASGNVAPISGTFTQGGFTFPARRGTQWIDLTGTSNTATGVEQKVATTIGQQYSLTFYVGNLVNPSGIFGTSSTINVLVDGTQILAATNSKGEASTSQVWKRFSKTFTATKSKTAIAFINGDPSSDTQNGLDGVLLAAAP